jgi:uncharacterized protein YodC (DUF2158 family)
MRGGLGRRVVDTFAALKRFEEKTRMADATQTVTAFMPGAAVVLADDIPAKVLSVQFRVGGLAYECSWWDGNTRHSQWVEPQEVKAGKGASPTRLGFVPPEGT